MYIDDWTNYLTDTYTNCADGGLKSNDGLRIITSCGGTLLISIDILQAYQPPYIVRGYDASRGI